MTSRRRASSKNNPDGIIMSKFLWSLRVFPQALRRSAGQVILTRQLGGVPPLVFLDVIVQQICENGGIFMKENPRYWRSPQHRSAAESFIPNKSGWLTLLCVIRRHQSNLWQANGEYYLSVFHKFPWKTSQGERAIIRTTFVAAVEKPTEISIFTRVHSA